MLGCDPEDEAMNRYLTAGLVTIAGAALFEAVVPAVVVGGAALLAPTYLPKLRRQVQPVVDAITRPFSAASPPSPPAAEAQPAAESPKISVSLPLLPRLAIGQALAKTVTFRVVVTALDFTSNYVVLGEFATAVGLSSFAFVAGPIFYFVHETSWNYLRPHGGSVEVTVPALSAGGDAAEARRGFTMSRALAKTITYRTFATVMDFTTIYVVVGDALTALGLSAFGFVVGPFVYIGHEKAWEYFAPPAVPAAEPPTLRLLPGGRAPQPAAAA
jgi:uncharacterized membrane protein